MSKWINRLSDHHQGVMPIRVLQFNLIHAFENTNPSFLELAKKIIIDLGLDPEIGYNAEVDKISSPFVVFKKITLQEVFLSYVWCITFSLTILHEEVIVKRSKNHYFGNEIEKTNFPLARDAYKLWEYAISLIHEYSEWDRQLPNPEFYKIEYEELIFQTNALYIEAMKFVLAHEFAHIELEHDSKIPTKENENSFKVALEKEADDRAIKLVLEGVDTKNAATVRMGVLVGLCSLLFFKSETKEIAYPDTDDRIDSIISVINPDPQDAMWGIATLAYKLWDRFYGKKLIWKEGLNSPKDLYYSIKRQVK